jgi:hypothetical protein
LRAAAPLLAVVLVLRQNTKLGSKKMNETNPLVQQQRFYYLSLLYFQL